MALRFVRAALSRRILPDGKRESMTYDPAGNLESRTDFMARTTTYTYDDNNRLTTRSYPTPQENVSFTYTPTGRRQTATDARGTTAYGYDLRDRLISLTQPGFGAGGAITASLGYTYDGNGNRLSLTATVNGQPHTTSYTYDDAGRLDVVTDPAGRVYDHGYDSNGNRQSLAHPNGAETAYAYDSLNRLTHLSTNHPSSGRFIQSYAFTLGPAGNRTRIVEAQGLPQQRTLDYSYDSLYRLTGESVTESLGLAYSKTFGYDPVGNRQTQTTVLGPAGAPSPSLQSGTIAYGYDTRDRLLSEQLAANPATGYTWDHNGNLTTKDAEATYTWNQESRLSRLEKTDGTVIEHVYDPDGTRVRTATTPPGGSTTTTDFLVDTSGSLSHVVTEVDSSAATPTLQALYVRGDDLLSLMRPLVAAPATVSDWQTRYYHADGLGSIRRLTDESGNITDGYTYSAFGELLAHTGSDTQPYAFTGEPLDPNSGLQYHRARWFVPGVGRFTGMDPFGGRQSDPPTLHKYLYGGADPANRSDPSGQETLASLSVGFSMNAVLARATLGAVLGGGDAYFRGYDIPSGIVGGVIGGIVAPFIPLRIGLAFTAYGVGEALYNDDYDSALFRAATFGFGYILQSRGFGSFDDFKRFWGPAGRGRAWHHIVEQTPGNVGRFGADPVHNPSNMVPLRHGAGTVHNRISGFYSSRQPDVTGSQTLTVRQWLSSKSFAEQYQFGLEAMARFGGGSMPINVSGVSSSWFWPAILAHFEEGDGFGQDDQ